MNSIMQDLRYALRQLRKAPTFALAAIVTLALGIGANTAIFTVFNQVLLRMLPVEQPDALVRLTYAGTFKGQMNIFGGTAYDYFSYPMYRELRDRNAVFSGLLANSEAQVGVVWKNQPELVNAEVVSGNYFDVLGVGAAAGRTLLQSDDRVKQGSPVAVLSYAYWKTRFSSSSDVVNQTLLINGHPFVIVGVAAQGFDSAINGYKPKSLSADYDDDVAGGYYRSAIDVVERCGAAEARDKRRYRSSGPDAAMEESAGRGAGEDNLWLRRVSRRICREVEHRAGGRRKRLFAVAR